MMWKVSLVLLWCALTVALACRGDESTPRAEMVCYYEGFLQATLIDPCKCTLLVISKVKVNGHFKLVSDLDFSEINGLKKKNPDLKVIVSVGGRQVKPEVFVSALSSVEGIANFTEGISTFVSDHRLDGVEINWRWPGMPAGLKNKDDLTALMRAVKLALDDHSHNVTRRQIELETAEEGVDPFSLLDIFEEPEEVTTIVSSETTEDSVSDSTFSTSSDLLPTSASTSKTSETSTEKVATTTEEFSSLSYDTPEEIDPSVAVGPDYLLLDDYFMTSEAPDREQENNEEQEEGKSIIDGEKEGNQEQEEKTQIKKQGERTGGRGSIKFKDHFKTSGGVTLADIANQQGAKGPKGGWKVARKRILDPTERLIRPLEKRIGSSKMLILTISPRPEHIVKGYDLKALTNIVDMFSIPSDNLTANSITSRQNGSVTYHHSRLMGVSDIQNADSLIDLIVSMGVPLDRLILSVSTAGSLFTLINATENTPRSPASGHPLWIPYRKVCSLLSEGNWTLERDEDLTGPYAYKGDQWMAFDDPISLRVKSKYALLRGLAGIGIKVVDDEDWTGVCSQGAFPLATSVFETFTQLARTPRKAVLRGLVRDLETADSTIRTTFEGSSTDLRISPFRIVRVVDKTGAIKAIRSNGDTRHECTRQGYYRDPDNCSQFYRCVKFNQYIDDYTIFEYSCPEGLVFDDRWEICAWPSTASPCDGSSEIFPVPKNKNVCNQEGYFTDPENCRWFYACKDYYGNSTFTHYEFRCPFGLAYDEENHICNWPWLVPSCGKSETVVEARGQGKAIKSGRTEQQFEKEEQTFKECVNCNEAEIKIRGKGIYHPEKGIIVSTTYFDKVSALESVKLATSGDEDQKRGIASTSNKNNKHTATLQNVKTNKVSVGKTFASENVNSEVPSEGGSNFKTDNLHNQGRIESQKKGENVNIENFSKTSFNERNHAIFVSKDHAIKHLYGINEGHSIDEQRSADVSNKQGFAKSADFTSSSFTPSVRGSLAALNNGEKKSKLGNNSPETLSRYNSNTPGNAETDQLEQFGLTNDNHRSPFVAQDNEYNSPVASRFDTLSSLGKSHDNTPKLVLTEKNQQRQTLFDNKKHSTHLGLSEIGHTFEPPKITQSNQLPTRKSIQNANVQGTNNKKKGGSHSERTAQQPSSLDSQIEQSSQAIFTPSIGSSIVSPFNHNDKSFDVSNVASKGRQQLSDSHFDKIGLRLGSSEYKASDNQGGSFNTPANKLKFNKNEAFGDHINYGAISRHNNPANTKIINTSRATVSGQDNIQKTNFRGNYNGHIEEVTSHLEENTKLRSNVHGDSSLKSFDDSITTQVGGIRKQATNHFNPLEDSLKQKTHHNINGKIIPDNRSLPTGSSFNSKQGIKNEYESNSRPRLQSGTIETSKSDGRSKSTSTLENRGNKVSEISKSTTPLEYVTVDRTNTERFTGQGHIGISELGGNSGNTEKLQLDGNLEYTKKTKPENIFDSRKSFQESSSSGRYKSNGDISSNAPQGLTINKGVGKTSVIIEHSRFGANPDAVIKQNHESNLESKTGEFVKHRIDAGIISGEKPKIEQESILKQGISLSQVKYAGRLTHDSNLKQSGNKNFGHGGRSEFVHSSDGKPGLSITSEGKNLGHEGRSGAGHAIDGNQNYGHGESRFDSDSEGKNFGHEGRSGFGHVRVGNKNVGHGESQLGNASDGKNYGHDRSSGSGHASNGNKNFGNGESRFDPTSDGKNFEHKGSSGFDHHASDRSKNFDQGESRFGHASDGKNFDHRGRSGFGQDRNSNTNVGHGESGFVTVSDSKNFGFDGSSGSGHAINGNKNFGNGESRFVPTNDGRNFNHKESSGFGHTSDTKNIDKESSGIGHAHANDGNNNFGSGGSSRIGHVSDGSKNFGHGESQLGTASDGKNYGHDGSSGSGHASNGNKNFGNGESRFYPTSDGKNFDHKGSSGFGHHASDRSKNFDQGESRFGHASDGKNFDHGGRSGFGQDRNGNTNVGHGESGFVTVSDSKNFGFDGSSGSGHAINGNKNFGNGESRFVPTSDGRNFNHKGSSGFGHTSDTKNIDKESSGIGHAHASDGNNNFGSGGSSRIGHVSDGSKNFGHGESKFDHANDGKNIDNKRSSGFGNASGGSKNFGHGESQFGTSGEGKIRGHASKGNKNFDHRGSSGFVHGNDGNNNFGHVVSGFGHEERPGIGLASDGNKNFGVGGISGFGHATGGSNKFGHSRNSGFVHASVENKNFDHRESGFGHASNGQNFGHEGRSGFGHANDGNKNSGHRGSSGFGHASGVIKNSGHEGSSKLALVNSDGSSNFDHGGTLEHELSSEGHKDARKQLKNLEKVNTYKLADSDSLEQHRNGGYVHDKQQNSYDGGFDSGHASFSGQKERARLGVGFVNEDGTVLRSSNEKEKSSHQRDNLKHEIGFGNIKSLGQAAISGPLINNDREGNYAKESSRVGQENISVHSNSFRPITSIATEDRTREVGGLGQRGTFEDEHSNNKKSHPTDYSGQKQEKEFGSSLGTGVDLRQKSKIGSNDAIVQGTKIEHFGISEKVGFLKDEFSVNPEHDVDVKTTQFPNSYDKKIDGSLLSGSGSKAAENSDSNGHFKLEERLKVSKHSQPNFGGSSGIKVHSPQVVTQFTGSVRPSVDRFESALKGVNIGNQEKERAATRHNENYKPGSSGISNIGDITSTNHKLFPQDKTNSALNNKHIKPESTSHNKNTYTPTVSNGAKLNKNQLPHKNLEEAIINPQLFDQVQGKSINPNANPIGPFSPKNNLNGFSLRKSVNSGPSLLAKLGNRPKFQRFGPGGFRDFDDNLGPEVCERAGLFRHPNSCDKFYECYWDRWIEKFTLHIFDCPVTIVYDSTITACNWPFNGPPCTED